MTTDARQRSGATRRQRSNDKIVEAATRLFSASSTATMDEVAQEAGVSLATLYNHFPSRTALVGRVYAQLVGEGYETQVRGLVTLVRDGLPDLPDDQVREAVVALVDWAFERERLREIDAINAENTARAGEFMERVKRGTADEIDAAIEAQIADASG